MGRGGREDPPDLAKSTILTVYLRHYFNALYLTPSPSSPSLPPPTYLPSCLLLPGIIILLNAPSWKDFVSTNITNITKLSILRK